MIRLSRQELTLVVVTMIWGGTFLVIRNAVEVSGPLFFVGLRFLCAALLLCCVSFRSLRGLTAHEAFAGLVIGTALLFTFVLQTAGLQYISASKSAFITAFYVPLVPVLQWAFLRRRPSLAVWLGVGFSFAGLMLLTGPDGVSLGYGRGELLTVLSAVASAADIILISLFAGKVDVRRVTIVQVVVVSAFSFLLMPLTGESAPPFSRFLVLSACGLGCASAFIQFAMNWAQRSVSPAKATLIYAAEPVWAGIFGRLAGERLPLSALLGGALIVLGVVASGLRRGFFRRGKSGNKK